MKKYLFILATATIVASCSDTDTYKKDIQNGNGGAISFETFATKQTRATENSTADYNWAFFNHHDNFQVWGYRNTNAAAVFNGDVVTVTSDGAQSPTYTYTYSPIRYWDKSALEYEFYAAAPSDPYDATTNAQGWYFVATGITPANIVNAANQNQGYFTTKSTLVPSNIADATGDFKESFKSATDVDKMIAAPLAIPYANFSAPVQLNFIHILSRLNVTIKKDASLEPANHVLQQKVVLSSLEIKNLNCYGEFDEHTAPSTAGNNTRWSQQGTPHDYTAYTADIEVGTTAKYVIQSLVIPQDAAFEVVALDGAEHASTAATYYADADEYNAAKGYKSGDQDYVDATGFAALTDAQKTKTPAGTTVKAATDGDEPYLILTYTIQQTHDAAGDPIDAADLPSAQTFVVYYNLANAFGLQTGNLAFNEGWQNTLNITIKPDRIQFCANVAEWSTVERGLTTN